MTTRRENLLALLRRESKTQWTPCSINFRQWYGHHQKFKTLPEELQQTTDYIQAMKVLGSDLFSRNVDGGVRSYFEGFEPVVRNEPGSEGPRFITEYHTPHGTLRSIAEEQTAMTMGYVVEDMIKDWSRESKAYLWLAERRRHKWDREAYLKTHTQFDDDGVVMVPVGYTPLKSLHWDFGLDHATLFMMDEPEVAKELCDVYWNSLWPVLVELAADPLVDAACLMDNVDSPFYSPSLCELYWTPYVRQAVDLFEQHNKTLFVHACGRLKGLKDVFRESGVHGLEGAAHAPLGDFEPGDAVQISERFIYNAGFTAHEQTSKSDDEIERFYEGFFKQVEHVPRFIFGAACQTAINTPWERIKRVTEICRERGGRPG